MARPVILVVDDDLPILTLMRNVLREFGFDPRVASSGSAAISAAREEPPDLILLDKNMPGTTVDETIRSLRSHRAVPIVILSGEPVDPDELASLGAAGSVMKPFDIRDLVERIRGFVGVAR